MDNIARVAAISAAVFAFMAAENAKEAHKHMHEIACHVGANDLCGYHKDGMKEDK